MLYEWRADGGATLALLFTVQGLVEERERVRRAYAGLRPRALALGVSPEMAANLLRYERDPEADIVDDLPDHDYVYSVRLAEYGEVDLPPPDLMEAARLSKADGVPLYGVDLPEERYEELFTTSVSTFGFLKYGRLQRRLAKRPPRAPDARSFALAWDATMRKVKGLRVVEAAREEHIAAQLEALARQAEGAVLAVVDVAREEGVRRHLSGRLGEPRAQD